MDGNNTKIKYDSYDDHRFPITFLHKAFWILENKGAVAFRNYVNKIGMPSQDVERVLNKSAYIHNPEFRAKINEIIQKIKNLGFDLKQSAD